MISTVDITTIGNNNRKIKEAVWQIAPVPWMEMYNRLLSYKEQHDGSTWVPQKYIEHHKLGSWVFRQRAVYCRGKLSKKRISLLESIGFQWKRVDRFSWMEMYQRLETYKKKYKNTRVPSKYEADSKLGRWVAKQRSYCKEKDQIGLLDDIGFEWNLQNSNWEIMYQRLVAYKKKHGTTCVSRTNKVDPQLGRWVNTQRKLCKEKDRIDLLDDIGFVWEWRDRQQFT
jgi:hypothetical protein